MLNIQIRATSKQDAVNQLAKQLTDFFKSAPIMIADAEPILVFAKARIARLRDDPASDILVNIVGSLSGRINGQSGDYITGSEFGMTIIHKPKENK